MPLNTDEMKVLVRQYVEVVLKNQKNELMDRYIKTEIVSLTGADSGVLGNHIQHMKLIHEAFCDIDYRIIDLVAEENTVVAHLHVSGVHCGQYAGTEPSNQRVGWQGALVCRFRRNRIAECWGYWNVAEAVCTLRPSHSAVGT